MSTGMNSNLKKVFAVVLSFIPMNFLINGIEQYLPELDPNASIAVGVVGLFILYYLGFKK